MGDRKRASRKRAEGTREHIVAYLVQTGELSDPGGMASTRLATAVGYPGSSVAFAQLLSGMERSGIIERDVRGKRTYRIGLNRAHRAGPGSPGSGSAGVSSAGVGAGAGVVSGAGRDGAAGVLAVRGSGAGLDAVGGPGLDAVGGPGLDAVGGPGLDAGFDYDELARRLLAQVVRRLAGSGLAGSGLAEPQPAEPELTVAPAADATALRATVADLESELATAWTRHGKLAEENVRLREQLRIAEESLTLARESLRRLPSAADLDGSEMVLLQRLLSPEAGTAGYSAATPG